MPMRKEPTFILQPNDSWLGNSARLPAAQLSISSLSLSDLVAALDLELATLSRDQVASLVAARNCLGWLEGTPVLIAQKATLDRQKAPVAKDQSDRFKQPDFREIPTPVPSSDSTIVDAKGVEDLESLLTEEWAIFKLNAAEFHRRLLKGEALKIEYFEHETFEIENPERQFHEQSAIAQAEEQLVYVLLDSSQTMNNRDHRGIVSRGLALAFLIRGLDEGTRLNFRNFTHQVGQLDSGYGLKTLKDISRRILTLDSIGMTNIQRVIETADSDIRSNPKITGSIVVLITDGISKLEEHRPLGDNVALHSYIIGNIEENTDPTEWRNIKEQLRTLKIWSRPGDYQSIEADDLNSALKPSHSDIICFKDLLNTVDREMSQILYREELDQMLNALSNLNYLLSFYSIDDENCPFEIFEMKSEVARLNQELKLRAEQGLLEANKSTLDQSELTRREARRDLTQTENRSGQQPLSWNWTLKPNGVFGEGIKLGELINLLKQLWGRVQDYVTGAYAYISKKLGA